ncbi:unnamed protein product [Chrysoparadoxa australica]
MVPAVALGCLLALLAPSQAFMASGPGFASLARHQGVTTLQVAPATDEEVVRQTSIKQFYEVIKAKISSPESGVKERFQQSLYEFLDGYTNSALKAGIKFDAFQYNIGSLMKFIPQQLSEPFKFQLYHEAIREPFDMYEWGNSFFSPMVEFENSSLAGKENLEKIAQCIKDGDNVFLLSNHQTEADPQVISLLMEKEGYGELAEKLINVAGHRVTTDPLAIPFSMGRNLFCIYSKKYMETPPELKGEKQAHNVQTLKRMAGMMSEGGQFIWVAPSGGRDRPDPDTGKFVVAPFDPKSVEVFRLMAAKASRGANKTKTRFFSFAMWTNRLVPPPDTVNKELGEKRTAERGPVSIYFGEEIASAGVDRATFAAAAEGATIRDYEKLNQFHGVP